MGATPDPERSESLMQEREKYYKELVNFQDMNLLSLLKIQIKSEPNNERFDTKSRLTGRVYSFNIAGENPTPEEMPLYQDIY